MSLWAGIKFALNSTLFTKRFKPLDYYIRLERHELLCTILEFEKDEHTDLLLFFKGTNEIGAPAVSVQLGNRNKESIKSVIIQNGTLGIGTKAFVGFNNASFVLPQSIKTIKTEAFFDCSGSELSFLGVPESIEVDSLSGLKVRVPWDVGEVAGAPWGATNVEYNCEV